MCPIINICNIHIYSFNICIALGIVCGILIFLKKSKQILSPPEQDTLLVLLGIDIPIIFIGAVFFNKIASSASAYDFFDKIFQYTGMAFIGGFLIGIVEFCILFMLIMRNWRKLFSVLNVAAPAIITGHIIGRLGCFLGGCCFGKPFKLGLVFAEGSPAFSKYGATPLIPTQLIEILCLCIIFVVIQNKKSAFISYITMYSLARFFIEFLRGDDRGIGLYIFSPTQTVCIILIGIVITYKIIKKIIIQKNTRLHSLL